MANREPHTSGEWYHCYNRGTDKRVVFETSADYERFVALLYTSNGTKPYRISDAFKPSLHALLHKAVDRGGGLVEIGAYALMPTHAHIVVRQKMDCGIARFMQKVFTGYTMYFNLKNSRTGALFAGTYKSRHVSDDEYFKHLISYVLLNPAELFERRWKEGIANIARLEQKLLAYKYSSLPDFYSVKRPENRIVSPLGDYYDRLPSLSNMLSEARAFYSERAPEV